MKREWLRRGVMDTERKGGREEGADGEEKEEEVWGGSEEEVGRWDVRGPRFSCTA